MIPGQVLANRLADCVGERSRSSVSLCPARGTQTDCADGCQVDFHEIFHRSSARLLSLVSTKDRHNRIDDGFDCGQSRDHIRRTEMTLHRPLMRSTDQ